METFLSFIPTPVAVVLMAIGFIALAIGGIRLGYKKGIKGTAYALVCEAEEKYKNISGAGAKKKSEVFAVLRALCPAAIRWIITDEVIDIVIETAVKLMKQVLADKKE